MVVNVSGAEEVRRLSGLDLAVVPFVAGLLLLLLLLSCGLV